MLEAAGHRVPGRLRGLRILALSCGLWAGVLCAQDDGAFGHDDEGITVQGEVSFDTGKPLFENDLTVALLGFDGEPLSGRASVGMQGEFAFDSVPPGDYQLEVLDPYGNVIYQEPVSISQDEDFLTVRLPASKVERPVSGTVSLATLEHTVPRKALNEFKKAEALSRKGHLRKSTRHLRKALKIDPLYLDAYNNLGLHLLSLRQFDQAIDEFRKAVALEPGFTPARANLGLALLASKRYTEAEQAARQALKVDPTSLEAQLALGLSLQAQNRTGQETVSALEAAARQYPYARLAVAQILAGRGDKKHAASELKEYLRAGKVERRAAVESWLRQLESD